MAYERITDKQKQKIIADYVMTKNKRETARMNNTSDTVVKKVLMEDNEKVERLFKEQQIKNTQSTLEYMQTQHETKKRLLDKILSAIEGKVDNIDKLTSIKDLATAYGIILDKELKLLELSRNTEKVENNNGIMNELLEALINVKKN